MQSAPLLKFPDGAPLIHEDGLTLVRPLKGPVSPVVLIGDGRGGKSYLASRILQTDDAFVSSDSAEPVTEGVDIAIGEHPLVPGGTLLLLDCEGGNNALAAIRTLVNVFGLAIGTCIVFVANAMASEEALQNLGASVAAKELIKSDANSPLPATKLVFVVNKNTLRYGDGHFEKILEAQHDPSRTELREVIKKTFPDRTFHPVPMMGMPNFEDEVASFRKTVLESAKPLAMGGANLTGAQLCDLLERMAAALKQTNEVCFPSMHRYVIFDGFLLPTLEACITSLEEKLPPLTDYDPKLRDKSPVEGTLNEFDEACSHVTHKAMVDEAREKLRVKVLDLWQKRVDTNEVFGDQVLETTTETREVYDRQETERLGSGPLKMISVTNNIFKVQSRLRTVRKKSPDEPEFSEWENTGSEVIKVEQESFDGQVLQRLPALRGHLYKQSPSPIKLFKYQCRYVFLKDMHLLWWKSDEQFKNGEPSNGCLNLLVHRATLVPDPDKRSRFSLKPASERGWEFGFDKKAPEELKRSFTGDEHRVFSFDAEGSEHRAGEWMDAIRAHILNAAEIVTKFGEKWIADNARVQNMTPSDLQ